MDRPVEPPSAPTEAFVRGQDFIRRCVAGDPATRDEFVSQYGALVRYAVASVLRSRDALLLAEELEDLTQTVLLSFFDKDCRRLKMYEGRNQASFATFVRVCATRQALDFLRGRRRRLPIAEESERDDDASSLESSRDPAAGPEDRAATAEAVARLGRAVATLSAREQLLVRLHFVLGCDIAEVAEALHVTENAVHVLKSRVKTKLRGWSSSRTAMSESREARVVARERLRLALAGAGNAGCADAPPSAGPDSNATHPDEQVLADYLGGALAANDVERFEAHVAACERCAEELVLALRLEREVTSAKGASTAGMKVGAIASAASASAASSASGTSGATERSASSPTAERRDRAANDRAFAARAPAATRAASTGRRRLRRFAIAAGFVLVATLGLVAVGGRMALDRLQPMLVAEASRVIDREVTVGGLGFALVGGAGLRIDDLSVAEDPRFGNASFIEVGDAWLRTDPSALLRGRLQGSVELDHAVVRLVRIPGGMWNLETLGADGDRDRSGSADASTAPAAGGRIKRERESAAPGVRLTSARIRDGLLEVSDRSRKAASSLVVRNLDLDVQSPDPLRAATLSLDGQVGPESGRTIALSGEIGPFTSGTTPRWRLDQVALERVPLASLPGAPADVSGELTFRGRLDSSGDQLGVVVANAVGDGNLELARGSLSDGNLGRDLIAALDAKTVAGADDGGTRRLVDRVLAAAAQDGTLGAALTDRNTAFGALGGAVQLTASGLDLRDVKLDTALFSAQASGSLSRSGELAASGRVSFEPAFANAIAQAAPALRALLDAEGRLAVPLRASGAWPRLRLDLDLAQAVASAPQLDPRRLTFSFATPLLESLRASSRRISG